MRRARDRRSERGMVLLIILFVLGALILTGAILVTMGRMETRTSAEFARTTKAFYAAEAGVARALNEIAADPGWTGEAGTLDNGTAYEVDVETVSQTVKRIVCVGTHGDSRRKVALKIVLDDLADQPVIAGGDLTLRGIGAIASEGVRIGGDAYIDPDPDFPAFTLYRPGSSTVYVTESPGPVTMVGASPIDAPAMRLMRSDWTAVAKGADSGSVYDTDGRFLTGDTDRTLANLNFSAVSAGEDGRRTVVVDGDVKMMGTTSGEGQLVASGKVEFHANARPGGTIAITSGSDVILDLDDSQTSSVEMYVYAEGDVVIRGGASFTGMIVALGNVTIDEPAGFSAVMNDSRWSDLSGVRSILDLPYRNLSWEEAYQ